jgi:hypothetical protein
VISLQQHVGGTVHAVVKRGVPPIAQGVSAVAGGAGQEGGWRQGQRCGQQSFGKEVAGCKVQCRGCGGLACCWMPDASTHTL